MNPIEFFRRVFIFAIAVFVIVLIYMFITQCNESCAACRESCNEEQNQSSQSSISSQASSCGGCLSRVSARCTGTEDYFKTYELKNRENCGVMVASVRFSVRTKSGEKVSFTTTVTLYLEANEKRSFDLSLREVNSNLSDRCETFDDIRSIKVMLVEYIKVD